MEERKNKTQESDAFWCQKGKNRGAMMHENISRRECSSKKTLRIQPNQVEGKTGKQFEGGQNALLE